MAERRLTADDVKGLSHSQLIGDFEVASRAAYDDGTAVERETRMKNLNILREEIYNRLPAVREVK